MTKLHLQLMARRRETDTIERLDFARADGAPLPGFDAGAHVTFDIPDVGARKYSLVNTIPDASASVAPRIYTLGVRLEPAGGGGSRFMHALGLGDSVAADAPRNNFPLSSADEPVVLVGGGIGITPLISMAAALRATGRKFTVVYAARSRSELAFLSDMSILAGDDLRVHVDEAAGAVFDIAGFFKALVGRPKVYMCGPKPMLKAGIDVARSLGWARDRLAFELFYSVVAPAVAPRSSDGSFEVMLGKSNRSFRVPPDKSILDVLLAAGEDPMHDCKRGECGVCAVRVIDGVPDHKDHILSEAERARNDVIQICISRSKTPRLVLDL